MIFDWFAKGVRDFPDRSDLLAAAERAGRDVDEVDDFIFDTVQFRWWPVVEGPSSIPRVPA